MLEGSTAHLPCRIISDARGQGGESPNIVLWFHNQSLTPFYTWVLFALQNYKRPCKIMYRKIKETIGIASSFMLLDLFLTAAAMVSFHRFSFFHMTWHETQIQVSWEIDVANNPLLISYNNMDDSPSPSHYKDPQSDLASRSKYSTNPPRSILSIANIQAQVRPARCQQRLTSQGPSFVNIYLKQRITHNSFPKT